MNDGRKLIHNRALDGIVSRQVVDWHGVPLKGIYFVESTLKGGPPDRVRSNPPIILLPGGFDPHHGEFSENLIRTLLDNAGAPAVLEAHYGFEGQGGFCEPFSVVDDLKIICHDEAHSAVLVALCGGCICALSALYDAAVLRPCPGLDRALIIGPFLPEHANTVGKTIHNAVYLTRGTPDSKQAQYAGHCFTPGNAKRLMAWYQETSLKVAVATTDPKGNTSQAFPIYIELLYFVIDVLNREGRARLRRLFNSPHRNDRVPGLHRSLRNSPEGDELIAEFYKASPSVANRTCTAVDAICGQSSPA